MPQRKFAKVDQEWLDKPSPKAALVTDYYGDGEPHPYEFVPEERANLITSLGTDGLHYPAIDIDFPCRLVESSPGKFHLYIDKGVPWPEYIDMLYGMAGAGVVEEGYVSASEQRGFTALRHNVKKPANAKGYGPAVA